jgi:glyoxylase-like metal-dependent hydrolase (beta-lactamase superfamily II)
MKKSSKRILRIGIALVMLAIFLLALRVYRMWSDMRQMTPLESGEVVPSIYAVRDSYVNLYLVKGSEGYVAVDAGIDPEDVRQELKKLNLDPAMVVAVFLTHGDRDHAGGLAAFSNARIFLSSEEEQMIDGRTARFIIFRNKAIPKHELLKDDQVVDMAGMSVRTILTPGHTPGATCYLVNGRYLFTGDSMRLQKGKAGIFSKSINMDSETQLQSLKRLARLQGVKYVFTAHFGFSDSYGQAFEPFR